MPSTTTSTRRRMRSSSVALGVTALMASSLTGCASSADYAAVCTDPETGVRVDDSNCERASTGGSGVGAAFAWYYLASSARVPGIGQTASGGTFSSSGLSGNVQRGGLPSAGGDTVKSSTTKGGFGGSSRGFG